jgi:uncharacterized protein
MAANTFSRFSRIREPELNAQGSSQTEACMLPVDDGYRYCLIRHASPRAACRGAVLFIHAFAEEMNKSRRTVANTARRLAAAGWTVIQPDLEGCGDSSGDFSQTTWERWQEDLLYAGRYLSETGVPLKAIWGMRLGALLAATVVGRFHPQPDLMLWQPVLKGKAHLTQFLRLKAAEEMIAQSGERGVTSRLRDQLAAGTAVEVAGYPLGSALAQGIDAAEFTLPPDYRGRIVWLETGSAELPEISPVSQQLVASLAAAGQRIAARAVPGPAFWQSVEIEENPALANATVDALTATEELPA